MQRTRRFLIVAASAGALAAAGTGTAIAIGGAGDDEAEGQPTGAGADRARAAALAVTGGGTANAVERDSEAGATWEVEVTRPDGRTVDVRLDERFGLVVVDADSERE